MPESAQDKPAASQDKPASRAPSLNLRREIPRWQAVLCGVLCIAACGGVWWLLTRGDVEQRLLSPTILPSPAETFGSFSTLWFDRALTRNTFASLRRVVLGFGLAALVGVPLGVLCGCFRRVEAFFAPLTIVGRNIPIAALIPLTFSLFGIDEFQKVMFIFLACVAFIISDTATAVNDVSSRYIDTAYTLGAGRWQIILKVLVPLAMPSVCNSLRLLFGLAFGYIMLAETIQTAGGSGGLGSIINRVQRLGGHESEILLILMLIPLVALVIDRWILYPMQCQLFPYQYGGSGILHRALGGVMRAWESCWSLVRKPVEFAVPNLDGGAQAAAKETVEGSRP